MKRQFTTESFASALRVAPAAAVVLAALTLSWREQGSIARTEWLPFAVLLPLVLATVLLASGAISTTRPLPAALVGLVGLSLWSGLSIAWSPVPSLARDESLLYLLYAVALAIPALTLKNEGERVAVVALVGGAGGLLALGAAVHLIMDSSPDDFVGARLTFPVTYVNANAAAFLLGVWSALALASRRALPLLVRASMLAAAAAALAAWVVTQSKGAGIGLAASALVVLAVSPDRLRLLLAAAMPAVLVAAAYAPLTAPFRTDTDAELVATGADAGRAILVVAAVAFGLGLVYAGADRLLDLSPRARDAVGRATAVGLAVALLAVLGLAAVRVGDPADAVADRWDAFRTPLTEETGSSHFVNLGSNRYDFWRVELAGFRDHPLAGVGARGFVTEYQRERRSVEQPARGHSVVFDALLETGIVGVALLGLAVGAILVGLARRAASVAGIAALGTFAYFFVHGLGDWIWTFPALGVPVFTLAGAALSEGEGLRLPRPVTLAAGAAAIAASLVALPVWLSDRITSSALERNDPGALRTARRLDPLAVEPWLAAHALATTPGGRIEALRGALERDPSSPSLRVLLGEALIAQGRRAEGIAELEHAVRLDPRGQVPRDALARARQAS
jgi:O-antigen ligase